jgi:NitT/TauT family transport system permease protein
MKARTKLDTGSGASELRGGGGPLHGPVALSPIPAVERAGRVLLPTILIIGFLGIWQLSDAVFGIPVYILPRPSDFIEQFWINYPLIWRNALPTARVILGGFLVGTALAVPLALAIASSRALEKGLYLLLVILQIAPKTIIAPLLIVWCGVGWVPQLVLTIVMTFFPILLDSMTGFKAMDSRLSYIAQSAGASRFDTFRLIRLPAAMPYIFSGLKIGMVSAITGAMVVEYVASNAGLGYLTLWASGHLDMPLMFAAVLTTAFLGLLFNVVLVSLEVLLMPWLRYVQDE